MLFEIILLTFCTSVACSRQINSSDQIAILSDYAEARYLLNEYYRISARKYGLAKDYNPNQVSKVLKELEVQDDGTEATVNRKEGIVGDLFENDILLTLPQVRSLLKEATSSRAPRQAAVNSNLLWFKMPIAFRFGISDSQWQTLIRKAIRHIESETCIRFKENGPDKDHLLFTRGGGCWSNIGRIGGGQTVSIGYGCDGGTQGNFQKRDSLNVNNMGQPYDLGSVMHYGSKAFSTNYNRFTIETIDSKYQQTIGQRQRISFKDAKIINLRYCQKVCGNSMTCYNGGYIDPNNCKQCKCPIGYGGSDCNEIQPSASPNCGGELDAQQDYRILNSTVTSATNLNCIWQIHSPSKVEVVIDSLNLPCGDACISFLELKYKSDMVVTGARLCCKPPKTSLISADNTFVIIYSINAPQNQRVNPSNAGFRLRYKIYDDGDQQKFSKSPSKKTTKTVETRTDRPGLTTTTTQRTTTTPARTTTRIASWSGWGQWSTCSMSCGGCGVRRRVRACYGGNRICAGQSGDSEACQMNRCPFDDRAYCAGKLMMPCEILQRLHFSIPKGVGFLETKIDEINPYKMLLASRRKRAIQKFASPSDSSKMCQKYFKYQCSTPLLTLSAESRQFDGDFDVRGCCNGFHFNGKICVPINRSLHP